MSHEIQMNLKSNMTVLPLSTQHGDASPQLVEAWQMKIVAENPTFTIEIHVTCWHAKANNDYSF